MGDLLLQRRVCFAVIKGDKDPSQLVLWPPAAGWHFATRDEKPGNLPHHRLAIVLTAPSKDETHCPLKTTSADGLKASFSRRPLSKAQSVFLFPVLAGRN